MAERPVHPAGTPWTGRGFLLYLLLVPLIPAIAVSVLRSDSRLLVVELVALALLGTGAALNRAGLKIELAYRHRKVATAPKLPRKLIGALLTGAGAAALSALALANGWPFGLIVGAATAMGCVLSYGTDPMRDKHQAAGAAGYTAEEIVQAMAEAQRRIAAIENARASIGNPELNARLKRIVLLARRILAVIDDNPRDLRRARRFLNTYLDGARRVTEGYALTHHKSHSAELESNFRNVLVTIETVFAEQHHKLLQHDVMDLDVQIEVLSTQLRHEGVV